jgi:hypothetical protein
MSVSEGVLESFHRVLVEEISSKRPEYLEGPFTVAEIYQDLVPYSSHRDRIGVDINGDYEDALIRLLAGEGGYLVLDSEHALRDLRRELGTSNPNTGVYREFAAVDVRLDRTRLGVSDAASNGAVAGDAYAHADANGAVIDPGFALSDEHDDGSQTSEPAHGTGVGSAAVGSREDEHAGSVDASGSTCRWCRATLPAREQLRFCPYCGTDVRTVPCAGCGEELEPDWRFCIACGTEAPS